MELLRRNIDCVSGALACQVNRGMRDHARGGKRAVAGQEIAVSGGAILHVKVGSSRDRQPLRLRRVCDVIEAAPAGGVGGGTAQLIAPSAFNSLEDCSFAAKVQGDRE